MTILTIGRVAPQKDPQFLAEVIARVNAQRRGIRWVWVGDGDGRHRKPLEEQRVEITGWLPRRQVLARLQKADLYVHTAAWEGNPMSLLEAAALGVPTVARSIPALTSLGYPDCLKSPADMTRAVLARLDGQWKWDEPPLPTAAEQRLALERAYTWALQHAGADKRRRSNDR